MICRVIWQMIKDKLVLPYLVRLQSLEGGVEAGHIQTVTLSQTGEGVSAWCRMLKLEAAAPGQDAKA